MVVDKYRKAIDDIRHQETLLFERLNFFLAGSAFLITAYAALAVAIKYWAPSHSILRLIYLVNGTGFYLSIFFMAINYLNTKFIEAMGSQIDDWESNLINHVNQEWESGKVERIVVEDYFNHNPYLFIWGPVRDTFKFLRKPFHLEVAPHTYILPLGLAIFWFIVFLAIFPFHFPTLVLFLSPLILALGFINIFIMHEKCWGWDIIGAIFILLAIFVVIDSSILNYCRTIFYILAACFSFFWIVILPFTIKKTEV